MTINPSLEVVITSASYLSHVMHVCHVAVFCLEQGLKALKEKQVNSDAPTSHLHTATSPALSKLYATKRSKFELPVGKLCMGTCVKIDVFFYSVNLDQPMNHFS